MASASVIAAGIADELKAAACRAREVVLVAPFITVGGLGAVLSTAPAALVTVYTRWRPSEVAAGVSDPRIWWSLRARGGQVFLNDALHAKVFLFDRDVAFVGSANLTVRGLSVGGHGNLEAVVVMRPPPTSLFVFLRGLEVGSVTATERNAQQVLAAAAQLQAPMVDEEPPERVVNNDAATVFPRLRSPDRLYAIYSSVAAALTLDEHNQALDDLRVLALPDGLSFERFRAAVAGVLRAHPLIAALDEYVAEPKSFGRITEWLKARASYPNHQAAQRHAQTLIRWLLEFSSDRYRLGQPHYAEVLERVES